MAFPLYLFLICIFVLPIAIGGMLVLPESSDPDMFVLSLPMHYGQGWLALLVYIMILGSCQHGSGISNLAEYHGIQ